MAVLGKTGDRDVDRALERIDVVLKGVTRDPILHGVFVEGAIEAGEPRRFAHGLGKAFRGWLIVRKDADTTPYEVNVGTTNKSRELWLTADADVNVTVYIF